MISVRIDVSKGKSTVCIMKPCGEVLLAPFEIIHTIESINPLIVRIKSYDEEVRVILEDTGHYHWPLVSMLLENNIFVSCINALRMKKFCSQSIRKVKTDKIDAYKNAQYGITYWEQLIPVMIRERAYEELRTFSRQYYQYISLLTKAKVNFNNLVDQTMTVIIELFPNAKDSNKLLSVVDRYWHFKNILKKGEKHFIGDYCKWANKQGYYINDLKAEAVFSLAQNGVPTMQQKYQNINERNCSCYM